MATCYLLDFLDLVAIHRLLLERLLEKTQVLLVTIKVAAVFAHDEML